MADVQDVQVVVMTEGKPEYLPPPVKTTAGEKGAAANEGFSPTSGAPFSSAFAARSVEETDRFVMAALGKGGDDLSPRLGANNPGEGELDALAFAMGALSELAADDDLNQARCVRARHGRGAPRGTPGAHCGFAAPVAALRR